ncbi:MAG: TrmH family RNA methyltransferase [Acidimicrobiales bacterium]
MKRPPSPASPDAKTRTRDLPRDDYLAVEALSAIKIDDPADERIEVFQGLRDHVLRRRREAEGGDMAGLFMAEGDLVVDRALNAGYDLVSVLIDGKRSKPLPDAVGPDVPVYAAGPEVLQRITGYHLHRGMLACFRRRAVPTPDELLAGRHPDGRPIRTVLVAEGINNPTNLGVILRSAAALGVDGLLIDPQCCDPLYRRCGRVSMGEAYVMPHARLEPLPGGLDVLRRHGFRLLALTPGEHAVALDELVVGPDDRVAIIVGAEGPGLTAGLLEAVEEGTLGHDGRRLLDGTAPQELGGHLRRPDGDGLAGDRLVRIPMSGAVDSLNAGVAAAIAFYGVQQARVGGESR